MTQLSIDVTQSFPRLLKAPIVEAVIEVRARAMTEWREDALRDRLKTALPDYEHVGPQRRLQIEEKLKARGAYSQFREDTWRGVRLESSGGRHIAQFNLDGLVFSRLAPYQDWKQFCGEALRLWREHAKLSGPSEIERLGVRFINRVARPLDNFAIREILNVPPEPPQGLPLPIANYFHQDTFAIPGHPYVVNRIQTLQPPTAERPNEVGLILDVDVFTTQPLEPKLGTLEERLTEMRWLKNKVFFGSVTSSAIRSFSGNTQ